MRALFRYPLSLVLLLLFPHSTYADKIDDYIKQMGASGKYKAPIAAQVVPFTKFWVAEDYHQDYIVHNPDAGYVQNVSIPEIRHFQKECPELVKPDHKF